MDLDMIKSIIRNIVPPFGIRLYRWVFPKPKVESVHQVFDLESNINGAAINSYSQYGEDLVIDGILNQPSGFYVDIGANDPNRLSNTKRFYDRGWMGINVEPLKSLYEKLKLVRPRDVNLHCGVNVGNGNLMFYELEFAALSSFDFTVAQVNSEKFDTQIVSQYPLEVYTLVHILDQYLPSGQKIDFLTIDTEGFEMRVLESNDWTIYRPILVLLEYGESLFKIFTFMKSKNYTMVYANHVNAIFLENSSR